MKKNLKEEIRMNLEKKAKKEKNRKIAKGVGAASIAGLAGIAGVAAAKMMKKEKPMKKVKSAIPKFREALPKLGLSKKSSENGAGKKTQKSKPDKTGKSGPASGKNRATSRMPAAKAKKHQPVAKG